MNSTEIYIQFEPHCASPHYLKRYLKFIEACTNATLPDGEYTEHHHICPSSMFPEYRNLRLNPWNDAVLSARQHFIAHWMLAKAVNTRGMWYALKVLTKASNKYQQERYTTITGAAIARVNHAKALSLHLKSINPETGVTFAQDRANKIDHDIQRETLGGMSIREHMSKRVSGENNHSKRPEIRVKLSAASIEWHKHNDNSFKGRTHTDESKLKQSLVKQGENNATTGTVWANNGASQLRVPADSIPEGFVVGRMSFKHKQPKPKRTCPHCSKIGAGANMDRYHFDNCKSLSLITLDI
jgi:hypothetical protein